MENCPEQDTLTCKQTRTCLCLATLCRFEFVQRQKMAENSQNIRKYHQHEQAVSAHETTASHCAKGFNCDWYCFGGSPLQLGQLSNSTCRRVSLDFQNNFKRTVSITQSKSAKCKYLVNFWSCLPSFGPKVAKGLPSVVPAMKSSEDFDASRLKVRLSQEVSLKPWKADGLGGNCGK